MPTSKLRQKSEKGIATIIYFPHFMAEARKVRKKGNYYELAFKKRLSLKVQPKVYS